MVPCIWSRCMWACVRYVDCLLLPLILVFVSLCFVFIVHDYFSVSLENVDAWYRKNGVRFSQNAIYLRRCMVWDSSSHSVNDFIFIRMLQNILLFTGYYRFKDFSLYTHFFSVAQYLNEQTTKFCFICVSLFFWFDFDRELVYLYYCFKWNGYLESNVEHF